MNRLVSDYIKGLAIFTVLCNHYINGYTSFQLSGFANGIISVFFVLSGYGIYASLNRDYSSDRFSFSVFYIKRFIRIYPLYLLSVLPYFINNSDGFTVSTLIALPIVQAPGIYWFITSLIQCYLIAPLIYVIISKHGTLKTLAISLLVLVITYVVYEYNSIEFSRANFAYRFIPLGHIFMFIGGMLICNFKKPLKVNFHFPLSFMFFLIAVYYTRADALLFDGSGKFAGALLIISSIYICYSLTNINDNRLIWKGLISFLGMYAYSVYLFHEFYYKFLVKINIIQKDSIVSVFITVLLMPIFVYLLSLLERYLSKITLKLIPNN